MLLWYLCPAGIVHRIAWILLLKLAVLTSTATLGACFWSIPGKAGGLVFVVCSFILCMGQFLPLCTPSLLLKPSVCVLCLAGAPEAPCEGVCCSGAFTDHFHRKPATQGVPMLFSWELPMSLQITCCPLRKGRSPLRQASVSSGSSNQRAQGCRGDLGEPKLRRASVTNDDVEHEHLGRRRSSLKHRPRASVLIGVLQSQGRAADLPGGVYFALEVESPPLCSQVSGEDRLVRSLLWSVGTTLSCR